LTQDSLTAAAAPAAADDRTAPSSLWPERSFGIVLLLLCATPLYTFLDRANTGLAGQSAAAQAAGYYDLMWSGLLLVAPIGVGAGYFTRSVDLGAFVRHATAGVMRMDAQQWALLLAFVTSTLTTLFTLTVMAGRPYHIDAIAQLLHARFWAEGSFAGPLANGAFWTVHNAIFTSNGWVSQYPPGHVAVLALAALTGLPWIAGPLMAGVLVYASTRMAEQLVDRAVARLGSALLAVSPFVVCLSGAFMNHVTAAAFLAVAGFLLSRETAGRAAMLGAGLAFGFAFATRPLVALVLGAVLVLGLPFVTGRGVPAVRRALTSSVWVAIGAALPFAALLAYNAHFFGSPFTFGYDAALGPAGTLGFGTDPWGNRYDLAAAIGYTSADVLALGVHLLETPLPPLLLLSAALLTMRSPMRGARLLIAMVAAVLMANLFYWHHGMYMGPRMLFESAPAWLLLLSAAFVQLWRRIPAASTAAFSFPNAFIGVTVVSILLGVAAFAPPRAFGYTPPEPADDVVNDAEKPAIVFVHENWRTRLAMRLAAAGMRLDSIETALRQNTTCDVQRYTDVRESNPAAVAAITDLLSLAPRAVDLPPVVEMKPGVRIVGGAETVSAGACAAEVRSDFAGVQDLASLLVYGGVPGGRSHGVLFVRDLGPARNRALLEAEPARRPYALVTTDQGRRVLLDYGAAMQALWRDSTALEASSIGRATGGWAR